MFNGVIVDEAEGEDFRGEVAEVVEAVEEQTIWEGELMSEE